MKTEYVLPLGCLLIVVAVAGCTSSTEPVAGNTPVVYELRALNVKNEGRWRHEYGTGMPMAEVVMGFIRDKSATDVRPQEGHVEVWLMPLAHAKAHNRPADLVLDGTGLGAFVTYFEDGKIPPLPDYKDRIPMEVIEQGLLGLCSELGVHKPEIRRTGFLWGARGPHNPRVQSDAASQ